MRPNFRGVAKLTNFAKLRYDSTPFHSAAGPNDEIVVSDPRVACFACGDAHQVLIWLLRIDRAPAVASRGNDAQVYVHLMVPLLAGTFLMTRFDTASGTAMGTGVVTLSPDDALPAILVTADIFIAITR